MDLWSIYDRVCCPVLLLHGLLSDILPTSIAHAMTQRGPHAVLVEFPKIGHAPALMDPKQIAVIAHPRSRKGCRKRHQDPGGDSPNVLSLAGPIPGSGAFASPVLFWEV